MSKESSINLENRLDGMITIKNNEIVVKNPNKNGRPAILIPSKDVVLFVDEKEIKAQIEVYEKSHIDVKINRNNIIESRKIEFSYSNDKCEAYMNKLYSPNIEYNLKEQHGKIITLELDIKESYPEKYKEEEINQELLKNGIKYGIIKENIKKCSNNEENVKIIIAKGKQPINDEKDELIYNFTNNKDYKEDEFGNIDFKSIGYVSIINQGDVLAIIIRGKIGENGINVFGKEIKKINAKKLKIKYKDGCKLLNEETLIATRTGKPSIIKDYIYVFNTHKIDGDVDIKTGNIKFSGDIIISGSVREGMEIISGNSVDVGGGLESATVYSKNNVSVRKNVLNSKIIAGGEDTDIIEYKNNLNNFLNRINSLIETVAEVKKFNILGNGRSDGEVIKILIEKKFKDLPLISFKLIKDITKNKDNEASDKIINFIKNKIIGVAPINIKNYGELDEIKPIIKEKLIELESQISLPVDIRVSYIQDSTMLASGTIYITGSGSYISNIKSNGSIIALQNKSVIRGGELIAKDEINLKIVGSPAASRTSLIVSEKGTIRADIVYSNTKIKIGEIETITNVACKNFVAYINKDHEIQLDYFKL
ncbi:MAG: DUF342 domain-containing protein [Clostridiaceae bacterium]